VSPEDERHPRSRTIAVPASTWRPVATGQVIGPQPAALSWGEIQRVAFGSGIVFNDRVN
jgi:hypothetical protein